MAKYNFHVNRRAVTTESWDPDQPLLYVLRNSLGLHGPKFGCGLGQCGACTVLIGATATRSCQVSIKQAAGRSVTTIEGLGTPEKPSRVQAAFIARCALVTAVPKNGAGQTQGGGAEVPRRSLDPKQVDSFLAIHADGTVTLYTSRVDVGTGISTAMTQMAAEELGIPVERIE